MRITGAMNAHQVQDATWNLYVTQQKEVEDQIIMIESINNQTVKFFADDHNINQKITKIHDTKLVCSK